MSRYAKPGRRPSSDPQDTEDAFVATTLEATHWAQKNQRTLIIGAVVLVGGLLIGNYVMGTRDAANQAAAGQLETLQRRLEAGDQVGVQADLETFIQRFGNTAHATEARMTLGQVTADLGDATAAVEILEPIARDIGSPLGAQAAGLLASIYEEVGNLGAAEGLYLRLADQAEMGFQVRDALADAARIRRQQGNNAGAVELYDRILADMEELDPGRPAIEMRRAEAATSS